MGRKRQKSTLSKNKTPVNSRTSKQTRISKDVKGTKSEVDKKDEVKQQCHNREVCQAEICDVGWQSSSPISLTQVVRVSRGEDYSTENFNAAIQKLAADRGPVGLPTCTPPLLGLWTDHEVEDEKAKPKTRSTKKEKGKHQRRPRGIKASISSKELLLSKLTALIDEAEEEEKEKTEEKLSITSTTQSTISAQNPLDNPYSEPLFSQDPRLNNSFELFGSTQTQGQVTPNEKSKGPQGAGIIERNSSSGQLSHSIKKLDASPLFIREATSGKLILARNVSSRAASSPGQESPLGCKKLDQSCEDLWTDEEIFNDDSFIMKATQVDSFTSPRAPKRRSISATPQSRQKKSRYDSDFDSLSPILGKNKNTVSEGGILTSTQLDGSCTKQLPFQSYYDKNRSTNKNGCNAGTFAATSNYQAKSWTLNSQKPVPFTMRNPNIKSNLFRVPLSVNSSKMECTKQQQSHTMSNTRNKFAFKSQTDVTLGMKNSVKTIPKSASPSEFPGTGYNSLNNQLAMKQNQEHQVKRETNPVIRPGQVNNIPGSKMGPYRANSVGPTIQVNVSTSLASHKPPTRSSTLPSARMSSPTIANTKRMKGMKKTPPRIAEIMAESRSPSIHNTSITDDLLATLAEPDDILDSQMENELLGSQLPINAGDDFKDDMELLLLDGEVTAPNATKDILPGKERREIENDSFPSDDDGLEASELLAYLDQAETQASQMPSENGSASSNKSTPTSKMSKLSINSTHVQQQTETVKKTNNNVTVENVVKSHSPQKQKKLSCNSDSTVNSKKYLDVSNGLPLNYSNKSIGIPANHGNNGASKTNQPVTVKAKNVAGSYKFKNVANIYVSNKALNGRVAHSTSTTGTACVGNLQKNTGVPVPARMPCESSSISTEPRLHSTPPSTSANCVKSDKEGQVSASQKYSPEEIERKKREALLRRQNRLRLTKKK